MDPTTEAADTVGEVARDARSFGAAVVDRLPQVMAGVVTVVVLVLVLAKAVERALGRTRADPLAVVMLSRIVRLVGVLGAVLVGLSVAGIAVGSVLAGRAVIGVAVGLAMQATIENFITGIIMMVRKPFFAGDQIRSGEFEGTVHAVDLRVTRMVDYDGEFVLIPNRDVYNTTLVNLTRRGKRRTVVTVGVDYRDDHDDARAVIGRAVCQVEGVLDHPEPEVLLTELGESSVNFEVHHWTRPDISSVRRTQDRVLAAVKARIQGAGLTIPWPIRTLVPDGTFRTAYEGSRHG